MRGYYFNNKFYTDTTYTTELEKTDEMVYVDHLTGGLYTYDSVNGYRSALKLASESEAGIVKLYKDKGENDDGAVDQKTISEAISGINFKLSETEDECLELVNPWLN